MTRKLALVLAACLMLVHETAWALGLGEISVDSSLNQPFSAEIDLRNTEALERNEIIANLASVEDFQRVGVERFFFLSDLSFETDLSDPDRPVIRVSSNQPITEPFVNFVVEVLWPSGRLLKEFTVLLDPPTYAARPLEIPQAPATAGALSIPSTTAARATAAATRPSDDDGRGVLVGDTYGVTDRNDTLWDIAMRVRPDGSLSVHQTMLALLRLNPEAFIGGNINQLKAGYVLRVPSRDEVLRLSLDDAIVQVAEQNDRWRAGLDRAPLDARQGVAEARGGSATGGELRLVSGTDDASASGATGTGTGTGGARAGAQGTSAADGALQSELATARAQLDAARRQNATLRGQMNQAATQVQELERQVQVRNEQIARLQAAVSGGAQPPAGTTPPATTPPATTPTPAQTPAADPAATAAATPTPAPAPSAPAAAGGLFGFEWPMLAAIGGGVLLFVVVVLMLLRRLSRRSSVDDEAAFAEAELEREVDQTQIMPALTAADIAASGGGRGEEEGEDVLAEADVYMAYGNFSEAAASLGAALETAPNRADIRLKLLEVHVEQGDVDAFNQHAAALREIADDATIAEADRLAARLPGAQSSSGDVTTGDAPAPARQASDGEVSLDFDLALDDSGSADDDGPADLDSLDIDLDLGGDGDDDAAGDGGLDFDLDLDGDDDGALDDDDLGLEIAGDADVDLDLGDDDLGDDDLGLDIAGDEPALDEAVAEDAAGSFELSLEDDDDDDGSLPEIDFDLDGDDDAPVAAAAGEEEAALDVGGDDELALDGDDVGLDFDIDDLSASDDDAPAGGVTSETAEDFADRTVILGGDDLEAALDVGGDGSDDDDDGFDFDIDDLAEPAATEEPALAEADDGELDFGDDDDDLGEDFGLGELAADDTDDDDATLLSEESAGGLDADLDFELDEEFDFSDEADADEITTKLELARAYVDMGDEEGAKEILDEVVRDGDAGQKKEAGDLLAQIG